MMYLYLFIYLLLAHLLADFVFQPEGLISWKYRNWKGVLVHAVILFVTSVIFFWPLLTTINVLGFGILLANAVLHFAMDLNKVHLENKQKRYIKIFFLDQLFHIVILIASCIAIRFVLFFDSPATSNLLTFFSHFLPFAIYLIIAALITYVYEIITFQFSRQKSGENAMRFDYKNMFVRLLVWSFAFGMILFFWGFRVAETFFE